MRHPFAGIIGLESRDSAAESRRTALKVMLAGVGTTLATGSVLAPARWRPTTRKRATATLLPRATSPTWSCPVTSAASAPTVGRPWAYLAITIVARRTARIYVARGAF